MKGFLTILKQLPKARSADLPADVSVHESRRAGASSAIGTVTCPQLLPVQTRAETAAAAKQSSKPSDSENLSLIGRPLMEHR